MRVDAVANRPEIAGRRQFAVDDDDDVFGEALDLYKNVR